jgi:hypothetical protein
MSTVTVGILISVIALIAIWCFRRWLRSQPNFTTQDKIGSWDIFIKLIGGFGIIIGTLFTAWQYLDQRDRELLQRRMEFAQQIYDEKSKVYDEAITSASSLANATKLSAPTTQRYLKTFWELYWGKMVRYESKDVEAAMVRFGNALKAWESTEAKPQGLQRLSLALAKAIKEDLSRTRPSYETLKSDLGLEKVPH